MIKKIVKRNGKDVKLILVDDSINFKCPRRIGQTIIVSPKVDFREMFKEFKIYSDKSANEIKREMLIEKEKYETLKRMRVLKKKRYGI